MEPRLLANPRVLYICGWGRSGTTIVDRILGETPGLLSIGELRSLWDHDPVQQRCGCGSTISACPVWGPILESLESVSGMTHEEVRHLRETAARSRHLIGLRFVANRRSRPGNQLAARYGDVLVGIYRALTRITGASIIVDSSKHPAEALLLAGRSDVDVTVLHLVRDPRAVAFSWSRPDRNARTSRPVADLPPERGAMSSSAWWTTWNGAIELLVGPLLKSRYIVLRYEDVMADTRGTLGTVVQRLGGSAADLPLVTPGEVTLGVAHTVAGNPNRMELGTVRLEVDHEWETRMDQSLRRRATLPALPLLRHYGYGTGSSLSTGQAG
ncbi:MAG: sulfotransferase [Acidimicrobiales bacterium]